MTIKTRTSAKTVDAPSAVGSKRSTLSRASKVQVVSAEQIAQAKSDTHDNIEDVTANDQNINSQSIQGVALEGLDRPVTGRGVFAVRTLGNAVSVESAFLEENGNVLRLPAVFPNREYALQQIDELRQMVNQRFDNLEKSAP